VNYQERALAITEAYVAGAKDYASTLQDMLAVYSSDEGVKQSLHPLLSLLGCTTIQLGRDQVFMVNEPSQPEEVHETLVTSTLLATLNLHIAGGVSINNGPALLNGLFKNNRWRACLDTVADANNLAMLLIAQSPALSGDFKVIPRWEPFLESGARSLYEIVNGWLTPEPAFTKETPLPVLACAMFGDIWYDLTFGDHSWFDCPDDNEMNDKNIDIVQAVRRNPPPLLRHLLSQGIDAHARLELPELVDATLT
jgi:hypothetical protein